MVHLGYPELERKVSYRFLRILSPFFLNTMVIWETLFLLLLAFSWWVQEL